MGRRSWRLRTSASDVIPPANCSALITVGKAPPPWPPPPTKYEPGRLTAPMMATFLGVVGLAAKLAANRLRASAMLKLVAVGTTMVSPSRRVIS